MNENNLIFEDYKRSMLSGPDDSPSKNIYYVGVYYEDRGVVNLHIIWIQSTSINDVLQEISKNQKLKEYSYLIDRQYAETSTKDTAIFVEDNATLIVSTDQEKVREYVFSSADQ